MKSIALRSAVAATLSLAAGHAFALPATEVTGTQTTLYVSGATATDGTFQNLGKLSAGFCVPGTLDIYSISNNYISFCSASAASGLGNTRVAFFKESNGGSANGIKNVANINGSGASALNFIAFTQDNLSANCGAGTLVTAVGDFAQHRTHSCGGGTTLQAVVPSAGVSDIDPDTFVGLGGVTQAMADSLQSVSSVGVTFSPIVSLPLYRALQVAQGIILPSAVSVGDSSVDQMPTMTSAQLRGIFSQSIFLADQLWSDGVSAGADSVQVNTIVPAADGLIHLCRRGNTSGTMSSFKILFLGEGCSKNGASITGFATPDKAECTDNGCGWNIATYGADLVFAGGSSGNVRSCMDYHSSAGNYAVGIASAENKPNSTSNRYRYVRTDGIAPTLDNVLKGKYDLVTENTLNNLSSISGNNATLWTYIKTNVGTLAGVAKTNEAFQNAAAIDIGGVGAGAGDADTGIVALPGVAVPAFPISRGEGRTAPVTSMSRVFTDPNNCNMSRQTYPTP